MYGDDAEATVCDLAAALRDIHDESAFGPTIYGQVCDAIWPAVSASSEFFRYAGEPTGARETFADAIHALVWSVIERRNEVPDEAAALGLAFEHMATVETHNHPKEDWYGR